MPKLYNPAQAGVLTSVTKLTASQIVNLGTTPVPLVAAPGAGNVISPVLFNLVYSFGTTVFGTTGTEQLRFFGTASPNPVWATALSAFMTATQSTFINRAVLNLTSGEPFAPGIDNTPVNLIAASNYNAGQISTITINAPGTGYAVNDTGTINGGTADATYQITSIGAGGAVTGVLLTLGGTKYSPANAVATTDGGAQPGVGTGFRVNITSTLTGDGTLKVVTHYTIIPVP